MIERLAILIFGIFVGVVLASIYLRNQEPQVAVDVVPVAGCPTKPNHFSTINRSPRRMT